MAYVPPVPLAHTTLRLTALAVWSRWVVPLCCTVSVGALSVAAREGELALGEEGSEQPNSNPAAKPVVRAKRICAMGCLRGSGSRTQEAHARHESPNSQDRRR